MGILDMFKKKEVTTVQTDCSIVDVLADVPVTSIGKINLTKGQKIDLTKSNPNLTELMVGLGWDVTKGKSMDCDAFAVMVNPTSGYHEVVSFSKLRSNCKSVIHSGDNLTGDGDGDDETITVKLKQVPSEFNRIVFAVNIYQAKSRCQHFGQVDNAYIRLVNKQNDKELARYDLSNTGNDMTALVLGEVYKVDGEWNFKAIGEYSKANNIGEVASKIVGM